VVASAGNDATSRPSYPAAFAPHPGGRVRDHDDVVPVSAVGARNPDGSVALFSNDGPWVKYLRPGASLVSTFPVTFDASATPSYELVTRDGQRRASIDPDDFRSGFGVWSGTSFAAPVLAGELAQALAGRYRDGDHDLGKDSAVARMRGLLDGLKKRRP
jgi:subtilisin family serine protease